MADFENIVVEGTAEQLRNVLDASAYTDQKMNQYGIQRAGYISLQSQASDSDDDIVDILPSASVKDEDGYPKYGIVEFSTSQERTPTVLRGIHDAINPNDATPLKQVEELLKNGNNTNQEAVLYTPQNLTPEQQAQARANIGAKAETQSDVLVVTADNFDGENFTSNYSSEQIIEHIRNGGFAVLKVSNQIFPFTHSSGKRAYFNISNTTKTSLESLKYYIYGYTVVYEREVFDAVAYNEQSESDERKAQARKNIDAMQNGVADSDLDMTGHIIRNVGQASFICDEEGTDQDTGSHVSLLASVQQHENNENAYDLSFRGFNRKVSLPQKVRLSNIAGGTQDSDAATVGQVKKAAPYLLVAEETDEGKGVLVVGDWDTMVLELKKGRSIILAGTGILFSESDVSVSIYHLAVAYQEDGYAVFFHTDERTHSIAIVRYDGTVEFKYVNLLELDPTLSLSGNYAAPASVVGKKLGNIETALDSIIAIQESLLGGGGE